MFEMVNGFKMFQDESKGTITARKARNNGLSIATAYTSLGSPPFYDQETRRQCRLECESCNPSDIVSVIRSWSMC